MKAILARYQAYKRLVPLEAPPDTAGDSMDPLSPLVARHPLMSPSSPR